MTVEFTSEDHLRNFSEFCKGVMSAGGTTPHMLMVAEAAKGHNLTEQLWRGGCYSAVYNYPTAEILWNTWQPDNLDQAELEAWLETNWKGLPLRRERKAVRTPKKLAINLISYANYLRDVPGRSWMVSTSLSSEERYEMAWNDFIDSVMYMGRYIAIRYLEFLRQVVGVDLVMPDIRPAGAIYPRQSLALMYPEFKEELYGGNAKDNLVIVNQVAARCKADLLEKHGVDVDYYTLQSLVCEYKQSVIGKKQYPGKSLDSEVTYWDKTYDYFPAMVAHSEMFEVREKIFPIVSLGEKSGWRGVRNDLLKVLVSHGYTWNDAIYDYKATKDLANPVKRSNGSSRGDMKSYKVTKIFPGLYQRGNLLKVDINAKKHFLNEHNISVIVGTAREKDQGLHALALEGLLNYIHYPIPDGRLSEETKDYFLSLAYMLARKVESGHGVLVYCNAGRNRSGMLNALIYRELKKCSGGTAMRHVRRMRPNAIANEYFEDFLMSLPRIDKSKMLVQLAGTNGSGKSTPLRDLYRMSNNIEHVYNADGKIIASWLRDMKCVVLGHYKNHNGGCDGLTSNPDGLIGVNTMIDNILHDERFINMPIFFEGLLMASRVNMNRIAEITKEHGIPYHVIHCDPPLEVCLARVYERNGNKPINESSVEGRWASQRKYMVKFVEDGHVTSFVRWETENYTKASMPVVFLKIVTDLIMDDLKEVYD